MIPANLAERYAAGSEFDPRLDAEPWEEAAAEAMSDREWNARFDDERAEVDR